MQFGRRFSVLAVAFLAASCGGGGGGSGAGPVTTPPVSEPSSPFSVANPFAIDGATSVNQVRVDDLRVFGDSYSVPSWQGNRSWPAILRNGGTARNVANYAIAGARAAAGANSAFGRQIDTWQASGSAIGNGDLTVAYFGYNDVGNDLEAARSGYRSGVDRLVSAGAASDGRRLFVTQIHDWSRNPSVDDGFAQGVRDWNSFVAGVANGNSRIVAVDLFTVFERIFQNPTAYGFTNVSTVDAANSDSDALFFDGFHFGDRGQDVIARVYRHYLTRGWDWANNIAAGENAAARLRQDLDSNRLVLQLAETGASSRRPGFAVFPIGSAGGDAGLADDARRGPVDPGRASFAAAYGGRQAAGGIALAYRLDPATTLGLAIARYDSSRGSGERAASLQHDDSSDGLALYWQRDGSGLSATTRFSYLEHAFADRLHDEILGQSGVSRHDGTSWSLDQRISRPVRAADATLIPWASLAYQQHDIAPYSAASLYTSDLRFGRASVSDVLGAVGLDIRRDPIELAAGRHLWLSAGMSMTTSLHRDDAEVEISEAAVPGVTQRETIQRDRVERFDLSLAATLGVFDALDLRAGYALAADRSEQRQQVRFSLDYRF